MKVLLVTPEYPPHVLGGVGRYSYEVTRSLGARHRVDVLNVPTYRHESLPEDSALPVQTRVIEGTRCVRAVFPELLDAMQNATQGGGVAAVRPILSTIVRELRPHLEECYDVIYVQEYASAPLACILHLEGVARSVVAACHLPLCAGFTYFDRSVEYDVQQVFEAMMLRIATRVVVPSAFAASVLEKIYNVTNDQIVVNPLGVQASDMPLSKRAADAVCRIGTVGRFTEQKGLHYLLDVMAALQESEHRFEFHVVGAGAGAQRFAELADLVGVSSSLHVHEPMTGTEIFSFYDSLDLYLSTSLYETFGLAVLEAMARGCPPLGFDVGALREVIGDLSSELLTPVGEVDELAHRILELSLDRQRRNALATACRERSLGFDWLSHVRRLEETLELVTA